MGGEGRRTLLDAGIVVDIVHLTARDFFRAHKEIEPLQASLQPLHPRSDRGWWTYSMKGVFLAAGAGAAPQ